jgi:pSer/pThr/pTyr-binding forkhead associated (FHA) protein
VFEWFDWSLDSDSTLGHNTRMTSWPNYALASAGVALAGYSASQLLSRTVNIPAATNALVKLATAGNVPRLVKLAASSPNTYLDTLSDALGAGVATGSNDRAAIEAAVLPRFETGAKAFVARWKAMFERGIVGVLATGGAIALAYDDALDGFHWVLLAAAAIAGMVLLSRRNHAVAAIERIRHDVLPLVIDALVVGPQAIAPVPAHGVTFTIAHGDAPTRVETLDNAIIKIGRMKTSHLQLDDDGVSRMHAVIERNADGVTVIDLGSSSGTLVNQVKVNKSLLHTGDVVTIGPFTIGVAIGDDASVAVAAADGPFRTPAVVKPPIPNAPSLRDGKCPICRHTTIKTVARADSRFEVLVCSGCGYTQEFADLTKLA